MLPKSYNVKHYASALDRFFRPALVKFFQDSFPFGQKIAENAVDEIISIFEKFNLKSDRLRPGQIFWNALDKSTRADSPKRRYVPVILTLVDQQDIQRLVDGQRLSDVVPDCIARMIREAYDQGGILSMRDLSLLTLRSDQWVSKIRIAYEKKHQTILPHTGVLHDMGSCITHKAQIVYKVIVEKKDPTLVAEQTNHSQKAVDRYLQDYNRVKMVFKNNPDLDFISLVTKISKYVVKQYVELYLEFETKK